MSTALVTFAYYCRDNKLSSNRGIGVHISLGGSWDLNVPEVALPVHKTSIYSMI